MAVNLTGALCLAASVLLGLGLPFVLVSLFVMVSAIGLSCPPRPRWPWPTIPNAPGPPRRCWACCSILVGGLAAPLVGLGGEDTAVPLGVVAASASLGASLVFAALVVPPILARRRTVALEPP